MRVFGQSLSLFGHDGQSVSNAVVSHLASEWAGDEYRSRRPFASRSASAGGPAASWR